MTSRLKMRELVKRVLRGVAIVMVLCAGQLSQSSLAQGTNGCSATNTPQKTCTCCKTKFCPPPSPTRPDWCVGCVTPASCYWHDTDCSNTCNFHCPHKCHHFGCSRTITIPGNYCTPCLGQIVDEWQSCVNCTQR